jgi:uncharacterized membrane protein
MQLDLQKTQIKRLQFAKLIEWLAIVFYKIASLICIREIGGRRIASIYRDKKKLEPRAKNSNKKWVKMSINITNKFQIGAKLVLDLYIYIYKTKLNYIENDIF